MREKIPGVRKLSVSERESLRDQVEKNESQLHTLPHLLQDKGAASEEARKFNTALQADEQLTARGKEKDRMEHERKELRESLKGKIPPRHLQNARPGTPEYMKAVYAGERALHPSVTKQFERYQHLSRSLDPENPQAGSVSEIID